VKKCICWCLSIIELKNARWNIEKRNIHVSDRFSVRHKESSTVYMELQFHPDPVSKQSASPVWRTPIAVYIVLDSLWRTEEHVEFYSKNKFEKLVHLVGVIIRIYHDARSSECQTKTFIRFRPPCIVVRFLIIIFLRCCCGAA